MDESYLKQQLVDFSKTPAFSFLVEDFNKNNFEKFKITLDKQEREEVYSVMQGMKELLRLIQSYENQLIAPEFE